MFELITMTKARVLNVGVLTSKDRKPDELPGAKLFLAAMLPGPLLAMFDGFLPSMLYRKCENKPQGNLDGMEPHELTDIGSHVKNIPWVYEQTGNTVVIDYGMGGDRNITLDDCKVYGVSFSPRQGGGVHMQWFVDALGLSDETRGRLTGLKSTDIQITMVGPEVDDDAQSDIEDAPKKEWPFGDKGENNDPAKTPEQALAESVGAELE